MDKVTRKLAAIFAADMVGYARLMEVDEEGTIARQKAHRKELIDPKIAEYDGRIVKLMGDGMLVEFASVVDAVRCAVEIQQAMVGREADVPDGRRIRYRVGVNLGDIVFEGDDIFGDGVNIAARLEGLAKPGGVCISDTVREHVETKIDFNFDDMGQQQVKNIARPIHAWQLREPRPHDAATPDLVSEMPDQDIRFCTTPDGVSLAYATTGEGPPLVKAANWLNHLEHDWASPVWRHLISDLSRDHRLLRYDERGTGLSDWQVDDMSFESWVSDLEVVVDAVGLERFALFGISQGCAVSIAYAARHPERVTHLVLQGGYARGARDGAAPEDLKKQQAMLTLIIEGWGQDNPAFRQMFTSQIIPDCNDEQREWFNELQSQSTSPANAARLVEEFGHIDVTELLPRVQIPTLVLHSRHDARVPFEKGRELASRIPNSRFVPLESRNHLILEQDPAWPRYLLEVTNFLRTDHSAQRTVDPAGT